MTAFFGKLGIDQYVKGVGIISQPDIEGDDKAKFVIENAGPSNIIEVRGRIQGQDSWSLIGTITGSEIKTFKVTEYDFLSIECTTYNSLSTYIKVVASGFKTAGGGGIETINVPTGDSLADVEQLNFTSSNGSVVIKGITPDTIDFKVSGSAGNAFGNIITPTGTLTADSFSDNITFSTDSFLELQANVGATSLQFKATTEITQNLRRVNKYQLSNAQITSKSITLPFSVNTPSTMSFVAGGIEHTITIDYSVSGNVVSWSGLTLDGVLEEGDEVIIEYY